MTDEGEMHSKKAITQWFRKLIDRFREEYDRLDELEGEHIANPFDYRSPTQIEVFWMSEPLENQIVVILHDKEREDKEIIVNGPYVGSEFLHQIDRQMSEPRWAKEVPRESRLAVIQSGTRYSDIFARILRNFLESIKSSVFDSIVHGRREVTPFLPNGYCWSVRGNVTYLDTDRMVEDFLNVVRLSTRGIRETRVQQSSVIKPAERLRGYGTHFYPPIWVGKTPVRTFKEIVLGTASRFSLKAFDSKIDGANIIVTRDGFIGTSVHSKQEALRTLNIIFGIAMVSGIPCFVAHESEIAEIEVEPSSLEISSYSWISSSARTLLHEQPRPVSIFRFGTEVEQTKIEESVNTAEKILKNRDLTEQLIFLLEGFTHYQNAEYSQSFIMNWLIAEKHISRLSRELSAQAEVERDRFKKLTNPRNWSVDIALKMLNISRRLSPRDYKLFVELKNERNNLVHSGKIIDEPTARTLLEIGSKIVKEDLASFLRM